MSNKRKSILGVFIVFAVLLGIGVIEILRGPRSYFAGFDRGTHSSYEKISEGDRKQVVVDALGEPRIESIEFNLPQKHGFEHFFDAAERSSAVEYYQWVNGMNWFYCIGFDSSGEVVIKGEGHS